MNEKVQSFIDQQDYLKKLQDQKYHYLIEEHAGLLTNEYDFFEATKEDYNEALYINASNVKSEDGKYFVKKKVPLDITEEEFASVEASIPKEKISELKIQATQSKEEKEAAKSGSATFFKVIAWLLFIGGLIIAIAASVTTEEYGYYRTRTNFNFQTFLSVYVTYFISGCFSLCAAELFKKLQTIVNLLKRIE